MRNTLRRQLGIHYAFVVTLFLLLLGGIIYHEFVREPRELAARKAAIAHKHHEETDEEDEESEHGSGKGDGDMDDDEGEHASFLAKYAEVFLYASMPVALALGWQVVRRSLKPLDDLARGVEGFDVSNLGARLPRSQNGDEVDRLAASFNNMAGRLESSFQQISEFTLHASHELKTPLTIMRSELETALAEPGNTPAQREMILNLLDELFRLVKIVDGLTLLTKADAGVLVLDSQPVPLHSIVRECYDDAMILAEPYHVTVSLPECEEVTVNGDRHRLRQLLLGLTDNALKYNCTGGSVMIALRKTESGAEITIANTGPGVTPGMEERLFERFVRGNGTQQSATDGCGLGLAIARWIVQAHHGTIRLETSDDHLTTVVVSLPAA